LCFYCWFAWEKVPITIKSLGKIYQSFFLITYERSRRRILLLAGVAHLLKLKLLEILLLLLLLDCSLRVSNIAPFQVGWDSTKADSWINILGLRYKGITKAITRHRGLGLCNG